MRLFAWPSSPYVRKALLVAHEVGVVDELQLVFAGTDEELSELNLINPIGRIPTLVVSDQLVIFESNEVCRFLAEHPSRSSDLDEPNFGKWEVRQHQAVVDAILDSATAGMGERRRPLEKQFKPYADSLIARIDRCLAYLEAVLPLRLSEVSLFTLSLGSALAYLDFRYPEHLWRSEHPTLTTWHDRFRHRTSMTATEFSVRDGW